MPATDIRSTLPVGEPTVGNAPGQHGTNVGINLGPFEVWLTSQPPKATGDASELPARSVEELKKIARSITAVGDPRDVNTWIPVADALPR